MRWILALTSEDTLNEKHAIEVEVTDRVANIILILIGQMVEKKFAQAEVCHAEDKPMGMDKQNQ